MDRFTTSIKGYNVDEVNKFVDVALKEYASMLDKLKRRDSEIQKLNDEISRLKMFGNNSTDNLVSAYEENRRVKELANSEASRIIEDAKRNANRIVNDALLEAEKIDYRVDELKRNMAIFKRKVRTQLKMQLDTLDDLDDIRLNE